MRNSTDRPDLERFSSSCVLGFVVTIAVVVSTVLLAIGFYGMGIFIVVTTAVILMILKIIKMNKKNRADRTPTYNWSPPRDETPMYTISASVSPARPAPRMRRASEPTTPMAIPGHPTSQYPLSLSSRLSHTNYNPHDGFSSIIIASHTENPSSHASSSSTWHSLTFRAPSVPFPSSYSPSSLPGHTATHFAANVQPPAYSAVAEDDPGLAPVHHTTPTTDEGPGRVSEPSNAGLPSYEAAMSTRQPAYEAPRTPLDDGPTTND